MEVESISVHPVADLFPMLDAEQLAALAQDIKENGQRQPIVMIGNLLIDGRNRLAACKIAGVDPIFEEFSGGDVLAFIMSANIHRRQLATSQRAMIAARLANMRHGGDRKSDQDANLHLDVSLDAAADMLGVSRRTVADAKRIESVSPELAAKVFSGEITVNAACEQLDGGKEIPHVAHNSGDNEWYTPPEYIDAARAVMGEINLDPASSETANEIVKADVFYSADVDGLSKDWSGKVWMNPPYASDLIGKFAEKLAASVESGSVTEAAVLVNNATETKWFQRLAQVSSYGCFPVGRVKFWHPEKESAPLQGQAVLYIGKNGKEFVKRFEQFGIVARVIQ